MINIRSAARQVGRLIPIFLLITMALNAPPVAVRANPNLTPGVWTDITPSAAQIGYQSDGNNLFTQGVTIDPENPNILYFAVTGWNLSTGDTLPANIWKTTDAGSDWSALTPLDAPIHIRVDPNNSLHLYAVDGVRGNYTGFWVSTDGGATWTQPAGFQTLCNTTLSGQGFNDSYSVAADPSNFNHVLVTSHACSDGGPPVVAESTDGGNSWVAHYVTPATTCTGGYSVFFLYDPALGIGNSQTWLFDTQTAQVCRTTDSGTTWTVIPTANAMNHGGNQIFYTNTGTLFSGGNTWPTAPQVTAPMRSTDNGITWVGRSSVPSGFSNGTMGIVGDGTNLYTGGWWGTGQIITSPESDGLNWTNCSGSPTFLSAGPFEMVYDSVNHIVYSSNTSNGGEVQGSNDGIWAYKVPTPGPPSAPTGLSAQAGNASAVLSWTAASGATSYSVFRGTTSGGESGTAIATGITSTSYMNTGLTNGTTYYYTVNAVNSLGSSGYSNEASVTPGLASLPIQINAAGPAISPFIADTDYSGGTTATNWTGTIVTTGLTNPAPQAVYQSERYGAQTYTIPGLTSGTTYTVRLHMCENYLTASGQRLFNVSISGNQVLTNFDIFATTGAEHTATIQQFNEPANGSGQMVIVFTAVTNAPLINGIEVLSAGASAPSAPTGLTATAGNTQAALSWTGSSGATSYNVYRGTVSGGESGTPIVTGVTSTSYTNTGLTNGATYYFTVKALDSAGTSLASNEASATPSAGAPAAPTGLTATTSSGQVALSWTASSGATSYNVYRGTTSGGESATAIVTGVTATNYTNTGLTNGTTYYFTVKALNAGGTSAASNEASATPQAGAPSAPTGLTATASSGQAALSWTASSGATSYNVYRGTTSGGESATAIVTGVTATNYTNTGLTNGTTYYFTVKALNTGGTSGASNEASATPQAGGLLINYGSGFSSSGLQLNGNAALNGTNLEITNGGGNENSSAFYTTPVTVASFSTSFSLQDTSAQANGSTFCLQSVGDTALYTGGSGSGLGYQGMPTSIAVKFDVFTNVGGNTNSTGLYTNGAQPTTPATDLTPSGVVLSSGHVINVTMTYNGTTLTVQETDATTQSTATQTYTINIPSTIGASTAYAGFTGATGGETAVQQILTWTYSGSVTTPPAPTGLTATAGNAQVALAWTASSGATSYNVLRSTVSGSGYASVATGVATTNYTNTGLTNGTTYYFVVTAANSAGTSGDSNQASATPTAGAPAAPTGLTATAGNTQAALSWTASSGATSYNVYRGTASGGESATAIATGITTVAYTNTGLTNGTTYYFTVKALNAGGTSSASNEASATPSAGAPTAPTGLTATAGNTQVALSWTASSGATSYNVYRGTSAGGESATAIASGITATAYTNTGLTNGTTYYFTVKALSSGGTSGASNEASATPAAYTINYSGGFTTTGLQLNGNAVLNGTKLEVTNGTGGQESSAFYTTKVNVASFTTAFSLQDTSAQANGITFCLQTVGDTALDTGGNGSGLGYQGMATSVAVKFDLFTSVGGHTNSTGLYTDGAAPMTPATDLTPSGVVLASGDVINITLSYNGTTLTVTETDATTLATATQTYTINIPSTVGASTAYAGFTGATGGETAIQQILSWTY